MKENQFKAYMAAAETLCSEYGDGYLRGVLRHFHGRKHVTDAMHGRWLGLKGNHQEFSDGYRDGYAGKPPRGFHGNLGNLNAQGELPANTTVQFRVNIDVKAAYVKQAELEGLTHTAWIKEKLDAALPHKNKQETK